VTLAINANVQTLVFVCVTKILVVVFTRPDELLMGPTQQRRSNNALSVGKSIFPFLRWMTP
jgi:hypothetical protein